jgi:hypothetical protein
VTSMNDERRWSTARRLIVHWLVAPTAGGVTAGDVNNGRCPTAALKSCVNTFAPLIPCIHETTVAATVAATGCHNDCPCMHGIIARLAGLCFDQGVFPTRFKTAKSP